MNRTVGQKIVDKWEALDSPWSEPADLARAIDDAIFEERLRCSKLAQHIAETMFEGTYGFDRLASDIMERRS